MWLLYLFVLAIPLDSWAVPGVGSVSALVGYVLFPVAVSAIVERSRVRRLSPSIALLSAFALWSGLTYLWSAAPDATFSRTVTNAQLAAFGWVVWQLAQSRESVYRLYIAFVAGAVIAAAATVASYARGDTTFVYETRYVAAGFDPNELGLTLVIALPLGWLLAAKRSGMTRGLGMCYLPLGIVAVLLTASRGAAITMSASIMALVALKSGLRLRSRILAVAALGAIAVALPVVVPEGVWSRLSTIGQQVQGGGLNQRVPIWRAGLHVWSDNLFGGVGAGAYRAAIEPEFGSQAQVAHNTWLSIAVEQGIVGIALFVAAVLIAARKSFQLDGIERRALLVALGAFAVGAVALTWEHRKTTWFLLVSCVSLAAAQSLSPKLRGRPRVSSSHPAFNRSAERAPPQ